MHGTTDISGTAADASRTGDPRAGAPGAGDPRTGDPRLQWSTTTASAPVLLHRRDGILPAVAAALSLRGETLTCTAGKGDQPPALHPLVQDFHDTLTSGQRERFTGRCPEAILLSRQLASLESARAGKSRRSGRKPLTHGEARRALKHAKVTARRIREDGDPLHGSYAPPCRSCTALLAHFGVRAVDPAAEKG
ncbi:YwqJ-related putative deaminase [Streptomyces sp. ERV7]|uniref:YwqJ-related putative deaminase n=1 Tax=Streptomyces sp. ERV7 TaxID=1322334 RepID=UPI00099FC5F0|nr:YwqJ-related putative deaminase [Streptomyces sp. ERV7]